MTAHVQHHGRVTQEGELRLRDVPGWNRAIRRHKGHDIVLTIRRAGANTCKSRWGNAEAGEQSPQDEPWDAEEEAGVRG